MPQWAADAVMGSELTLLKAHPGQNRSTELTQEAQGSSFAPPH